MSDPVNLSEGTSPDPASPTGPVVVVVGAGPAGLTAAYELGKAGVASTVLEADDIVGGISRTEERDGWRFDIGGHRFFTKVPQVEKLWHEILPQEDFLLRPRKSRIYYDGKYYDYPLKASNALKNLGVFEAVRCVISYAWTRVRPPKDQSKFEGYTTGKFGKRLYEHFFKSYTEKLWGVPATEIEADFAAQRIKNLNLGNAIVNALLPKRNQKDITSLIEEFQYPKYGPGMMWEKCTELVQEQGSKVLMDTKVVKIRHADGKAYSVVARTKDGGETEYPCTDVVSSMPFSYLLKAMDPPVPASVQAAADGLVFRDFMTTALIVPASAVPWDDNWIYIHAPEVKTMRIQNFGSWSPYLIKEGRNVLGLEYTLWEGDADWTAPDEELIERGKRELEVLGLVKASEVEGGYVVRMPKGYPMYDATFKENVLVLREWLAANAPNVHPVGRNGMHKYNNQDHSMLTAMLTAENILGHTPPHDVWVVNVEEDYHEEAKAS